MYMYSLRKKEMKLVWFTSNGEEGGDETEC